MLSRAEGRKVYDELVRSELTAFMVQHREGYDVIASADTLCYFGELEPVFRAAFTALRPGGLFCFTLEDSGDGGTGSLLSPNCRYSHSRPYVEGQLASAGLFVRSLSKVFLRNEAGEPVAGHLVVAGKN
jgi:predicted TPR repeat methyltransferase